MRHEAKADVAVLLVFFTRSETFRLVFDEVRKARPSKLFLYQDGPRGEQDMAGIMACRAIAEDIDWECEVHRKYQDRNYGCDPSGFIAHTWAFSLADKCIVLEDDVVPSQSFFPFCKEMLDRYEHDERVTMIAGFNTDGITPDFPYDYFFTSAFSIWGWASWRRVVSKWDAGYSFIGDECAMRQLRALARQRKYRPYMLKMFQDHAQSGKAYFETIFWTTMLLNSGMAIMPSKNMINNVGLTADSTHYSATLETMPHRLRRIFTMERHELDFPLRHPRYVIENVEYRERLYRTNAWGHPMIKIAYSLEELYLNLRHGNIRQIKESVSRRIRKWTGRDRHA